jgi:hypothetical protein
MTRKMLNNDAGALDDERVALRIRIALLEERGGHYAELLEARDRLREVSAHIMSIRSGNEPVAL